MNRQELEQKVAALIEEAKELGVKWETLSETMDRFHDEEDFEYDLEALQSDLMTEAWRKGYSDNLAEISTDKNKEVKKFFKVYMGESSIEEAVRDCTDGLFLDGIETITDAYQCGNGAVDAQFDLWEDENDKNY